MSGNGPRPFLAFMRDRQEVGGFTTEDTLGSFLPLGRMVAKAHEAGRVAPLEGLDALFVAGVQVFFPSEAVRKPRRSPNAVRSVEGPRAAAVEVVGEVRHVTDLDDVDHVENVAIGTRGDPITRPVYLPGYVSWEHELGHHDPLTDVFSLGLILASLGCGLDLTSPQELETFVDARANLFRLAPGLHPVLARAIVDMTELERRRRPQDLPTLLRALENYRDQGVALGTELSRADADPKPSDRRRVVLETLQERLFEVSRRNRLLHFRDTMATLNLTHASVPLSFDPTHIRPNQLLTWGDRLREDLVAGQAIPVSRYVNFDEILYAPGALTKIRAEAHRHEAEYGYSELQLVLCFLRWADLKASPPERYDSPLLLLPVTLRTKKGVRDAFMLEASGTEAQVNPVLRYHLRELYDIELPELFDIEIDDVGDLSASLKAQIHASEPAVELVDVDRPRIDLIHDRARRRLDRFQRRRRLAGRRVRSFFDVDYSYSGDNYHPLGLRLFQTRLLTQDTHLHTVLAQRPTARAYMLGASLSERTRELYSLRQGAGDNPYHWELDRCSVTLGNFRGRKMSLVRDYDALLERDRSHGVFDAVFSARPREQPVEAAAPELADRYDVVEADPTQAASIAAARDGRSIIIQGPPGTGKSQTITNLVADYVARGKRVLFLCEKRAAIDVVYHRLKQVGLHTVCCLIHDSQTDKKAFVQDLKATYELFLDRLPDGSAQAKRRAILRTLDQELTPLEQLDGSMRRVQEDSVTTLRGLLERAIALRPLLPELSGLEREALPTWGEWEQGAEGRYRLAAALAGVQADGIFAHHPLRRLSSGFVGVDRPQQQLVDATREALLALAEVETALRRAGIAATGSASLADLQSLGELGQRLRFLAELDLLTLLEPDSADSRRLEAIEAERRGLARQTDKAREQTEHWKEKLSAQDTRAALAQVHGYHAFSFFTPSWWSLRKVLKNAYDFAAHAVKPKPLKILTDLAAEWEAVEAVAEFDASVRDELGYVGEHDDFVATVQTAREALPKLPRGLDGVQQDIAAGRLACDAALCLASLGDALDLLEPRLEALLVDVSGLTADDLREELEGLDEGKDDLAEILEALEALAGLPDRVARALRTLELEAERTEAAVASASLDRALTGERHVRRITGISLESTLRRVEALYTRWLHANADAVLETVSGRFAERVRICSTPAAGLSPDEKELKKRYNRGRRELEHEFGKTMRYKPIRSLLTGESGEVVADLKPVWLMSPLSVSDTLPLDEVSFDVVIFDEASQVTLEEAVPAMHRAEQVIIVGDEMQLPPTSFFVASRSEDDELMFEHEGQLVTYDLDADSLLSHAVRNLPSTMLGWHYRSRSQALIAFSNAFFYEGRLLTVPDERRPRRDGAELIIREEREADRGVAGVLARPVSFHLLENGLYDNRTNIDEARYIARLVRGLLASPERYTVGVVAFSEAQQSAIEEALRRLAGEDARFADRLEAEWEREEDGHFAGLLVKNLENVQGDERDVVILSVCYGHDADGKMRMNFGPINRSGGERRLNVAFSRAKHHMAVVSSITDTDITNDYNDGANCLKQYLRYARATSAGREEAAAQILRGIHRGATRRGRRDASDAVVSQIAEALEQRGYVVARNVGGPMLTCQLAVAREGDARFRAGVLVDTLSHYDEGDLLARDMMKPRLLRAFGWRLVRVVALEWYHDAEAVLRRLERALDGEAPAEFPDEEEDLDAVVDALIEKAAPEPEPEAVTPRPATSPDETPTVTGNGVTRRFHFQKGSSNKFWEFHAEGTTLTVRWGRIGTKGQHLQREFDGEQRALNEGNRLAGQKLRKGYEEVE